MLHCIPSPHDGAPSQHRLPSHLPYPIAVSVGRRRSFSAALPPGTAELHRSTRTATACFTAAPHRAVALHRSIGSRRISHCSTRCRRRSFSAAPPQARWCSIVAPRRPPHASLQLPTARILLHRSTGCRRISHRSTRWPSAKLQCSAATGAVVLHRSTDYLLPRVTTCTSSCCFTSTLATAGGWP